MKKSCYSASYPLNRVTRILIRVSSVVLMVVLFITGCTKSEFNNNSESSDKSSPIVVSVTPVESSSVPTISAITVTFSEKMDPSTINNSTFVLRRGAQVINGTVTYSEKTATFKPTEELEGNTIYTMTVKTDIKDLAGNEIKFEYAWAFTTAAVIDVKAPFVVSVAPSANATSVPVTTKMISTFNEEIKGESLSSTTFIVKTGSSTIPGTISVSGGIVTFTPSALLSSGTLYNITVTKEVKDAAGNPMTADFSWSFTTLADVTAPTVSSVLPAANATAVQTNIKPSVTFSEPMNNSTITTSSILLKQGSTSLAGTVSVSGNTATFSPAAVLSGNTQYSVTITNGVKDLAGNPLSVAYTWNFTTGTIADVTPPVVSSVAPSSNATGVAVTIKPAVTFSEPMNNSTISTSTILLKQGTTNIPGTVGMSGNTATFTPTSALNGNLVYTVSVTTGVKDAAGNPMAANYSWSFTTVSTAPVAKSFATDVVPILNICNTCHTHGWTPSSTASTFHANLVSGGYINLTTPTNGKIYNKLSGGHPPSTVTAAQKATVLTWIQEGSKNN